MPGMTGLELLVHVKKLRPEIKVILMTAFNIDKQDLQKLIPSAKIDGFLSKPFRTAELIESLEKVASRINN
jgi:CheY-like chemotaxis protein